MSPVFFLKHTTFPEVGQGAISYTISYTRPEVFRTGAQKVKEIVQEIAPCPKLQEIWIFFQLASNSFLESGMTGCVLQFTWLLLSATSLARILISWEKEL